MLTPESSSEVTSDPIDRLEFHYDKSPQYRSVHVDGVIGAPNARGAIAMTVYSERLAIPTHVEVEVEKSGDQFVFGPEQIVDGKTGILRQMEVTLFADLTTAKELREWLDKAISALESQRGSPPQKKGEGSGA